MGGNDPLTFLMHGQQDSRDEVGEALAHTRACFEEEGLIGIECTHDLPCHGLLLGAVFHAQFRLKPTSLAERFSHQIKEEFRGGLCFDFVLKTNHSGDEGIPFCGVDAKRLYVLD